MASQFTSTPPPITVSINLNPTVSPNLATSRCTNNSTSNEGSSDNMETRGPINQFGWIWSWTGQPATLWANRRRVGDRSGGGGTHAGSRIIELSEADKRATVNFTEQVLGQDGVFVLRLVELNVGRPMATQLVEMIWNRYRYATCVMRAQTGSKQGFAVLPATSCPPLPLRQQLKTEETPLPPPRLKTMQKSVEETEVEAIFPMPPPPTPDAYQPESNTHHQQVYLNHRSRHGSQGQTQTSRGGGMGCWLRKAGMIADSLNNSASSRSEYDMEPRLRHRGLEYRHRHHSSARSSYGDRRSDDMRTRNSWDRENF
ncbi:unnamed protein product [Protopolystoma xenopodis]|uniref:Uncharacterized protein n=1 Tax=Protopolystoma xenopodis TaxID=117903 RepID=A0A448WIT6_9PLAT|nr:unnamed protein product [Protopolystoma xenopodis]